MFYVFCNMMAWWQLNGHFTERLKAHWFWSSPYWMALYGIPIGFLFFEATRLSYEHFGFTWNIRLMGFGLGTIVFGIMSYIFLEEIYKCHKGCRKDGIRTLKEITETNVHTKAMLQKGDASVFLERDVYVVTYGQP